MSARPKTATRQRGRSRSSGGSGDEAHGSHQPAFHAYSRNTVRMPSFWTE